MTKKDKISKKINMERNIIMHCVTCSWIKNENAWLFVTTRTTKLTQRLVNKKTLLQIWWHSDKLQSGISWASNTCIFSRKKKKLMSAMKHKDQVILLNKTSNHIEQCKETGYKKEINLKLHNQIVLHTFKEKIQEKGISEKNLIFSYISFWQRI